MATEIPFLVTLLVTLTANQTSTVTYTVSANETLEIHTIQQKSTGGFNLTGITDSRGKAYTNATPSLGIDSDFIQDAPSANIGLMKFPVPLVIGDSMSLTIQVQDTSGAGNTIEILLSGKLTYG